MKFDQTDQLLSSQNLDSQISADAVFASPQTVMPIVANNVILDINLTISTG